MFFGATSLCRIQHACMPTWGSHLHPLKPLHLHAERIYMHVPIIIFMYVLLMCDTYFQFVRLTYNIIRKSIVIRHTHRTLVLHPAGHGSPPCSQLAMGPPPASSWPWVRPLHPAGHGSPPCIQLAMGRPLAFSWPWVRPLAFSWPWVTP